MEQNPIGKYKFIWAYSQFQTLYTETNFYGIRTHLKLGLQILVWSICDFSWINVEAHRIKINLDIQK